MDKKDTSIQIYFDNKLYNAPSNCQWNERPFNYHSNISQQLPPPSEKQYHWFCIHYGDFCGGDSKRQTCDSFD